MEIMDTRIITTCMEEEIHALYNHVYTPSIHSIEVLPSACILPSPNIHASVPNGLYYYSCNNENNNNSVTTHVAIPLESIHAIIKHCSNYLYSSEISRSTNNDIITITSSREWIYRTLLFILRGESMEWRLRTLYNITNKIILQTEWSLIRSCLLYKPKTIPFWSYKTNLLQFILSKPSTFFDVESDLQLCTQIAFQTQKQRNYHVWNYRYTLITTMMTYTSSPESRKQILSSELSSLAKHLSSHPHELAGWIHRTRIVQYSLVTDLITKLEWNESIISEWELIISLLRIKYEKARDEKGVEALWYALRNLCKGCQDPIITEKISSLLKVVYELVAKRERDRMYVLGIRSLAWITKFGFAGTISLGDDVPRQFLRIGG